MPSFLSPLLHGAGDFCLRNARTNVIFADDLTPAFDSASRKTGLLRHESLPDGHAIIIAPTSAIHTWFMRFPIDVVFVDQDGEVRSIVRNLQPWRIAASPRAYAAVEMAGGVERDLIPGDRLYLAGGRA